MTCTPERSTALVGEAMELYRRMWVLRLLDMVLEESRIDGLLIGPMQAAFGQEAVAVGTNAALRPGDVITTTISHFRRARQVGLALPLAPAIAEMTGPSPDTNDGSEESAPAADWKRGLSSSIALGQSTLFALGDAHAQRLAGESNVTPCVVGERDADSAEFIAATNIAVSWQLPVVFVIESIRDASSARRGGQPREGHGMPALVVDGNDVEAVREWVGDGVQRASAGGGPTLVEAVTYRTNDVSGVDPLVFARQQLIGDGVSGIDLYEVERRARHLVAEAGAFAKAMSRPEQPASVWEPEHWPGAM